MKIRPMNRNSKDDLRLLKSICINSGSKSVAKERTYIERELWITKDKPQNLWCYIIDDYAFYMCHRNKKDIRCILTAVREDMHGKGIGKLLNNHCLRMMKENGIDTFRLRTNQSESAVHFWEKQGAKIVDINGEDYEMVLKIKI